MGTRDLQPKRLVRGSGKRRSSSASREAQPRQRSEWPCRGSAVRPRAPATGPGTSGDRWRGRGQGEAERWHRPRAAPRPHPLPSAPRARPPNTVNLLTTGRGTSKPGHFNIGAARETEGTLEDTGTLDGNRRSWLRRDLRLRAGGPRARRPPRTQHVRQRKQEEKEEKGGKVVFIESLVLRGGEGRARPAGSHLGSAGVGHGGAAEGRGGFLPPCQPSPLSQRRESAAGALACGSSSSSITPSGAHRGGTRLLNSCRCSRSAKLFNASGAGRARAAARAPHGCPAPRDGARNKNMAWECAAGDAGYEGSTQARQPKKTPRPSSMQ
ncbi:PREDICTED: uncharacterized protein LOC108495845 [Lepidothrix coronata]|uniref:Uncharacterized protein LOC108495845 n=1 Tax=Lepidothrix coronata TaxID=321398 RepID=A0A6J0H168_9PASS|nr:PREDICTED: uncharacterized protein LOC108495845 [Lepidothrix coronata]